MEIVITRPILQGTWGHRRFAFDAADDFSLYQPQISQSNLDLPFTILTYSRGYPDFRQLLRNKEDDGWEWFSLNQWAHQLSNKATGSQLIALEHLKDLWRRSGVIYYQHQLDAARKVIYELHGRAILADEVGLGKTIEAGLVLKEYLLRKQVRKILILTPASLCRQWQQELREKFDISAWTARREYDWITNDILIASIDLAKQSTHQKIILSHDYDLVIVDEAHKLKNERTRNWQLINGLSSKYLLLLTATPVQNNLKELYNLITLLKPGQLGTYREFRKKYVAGQREPKNSEGLRSLLKEVMIRHRRSDSGINLPKRNVRSITVHLSSPEVLLYQGITNYIRSKTSLLGMQAGLPLITLQREVCSSPHAVAVTLARMHQKADPAGQHELFELLKTAVSIDIPAKAQVCLDLVKQHQDKLIVFTEYRATQKRLLEFFASAGYKVIGFDGTLSAGRKQWISHLFRRRVDIMVSTESGGEGLNFQFCNAMINYDLPWNPMRLEQRIGRIHRLGQVRDVIIYNLATAGTVEAHLLNLLDEKINMFNMVVGELEALFGPGGAIKSFEGEVYNAIIESKDEAELKDNFARLAREITATKRQWEETQWKI